MEPQVLVSLASTAVAVVAIVASFMTTLLSLRSQLRRYWHIEQDVDNLLDLYASDTVHVRYAALRGRIIGIVADSGFTTSPVVSWEEVDDEVKNVEIERSPDLGDLAARDAVRARAMSDAIDLISKVRAEMQGRVGSQYFLIYRLSR